MTRERYGGAGGPLLAVALVALALAHDPAPARAQGETLPEVHALTGARIVVAPGEVLESATVVLRDGLIEAVAADLEPPADARIWERSGLTVYAGFIEPYLTLDWPGDGGRNGEGEENGDEEERGEDVEKGPQGGHENPLVTPERDMALFAVEESRFERLRAAGFTSALVGPRHGLFRGSSALVNLGTGTLHDLLLRRNVAQHAALETRDDEYPASLMGSVALARQTLLDARWYAAAHAAYDADPRQARPPFNRSLAALGAVAAGRAPVVLESADVLDTLRLQALVAEFGLDALVVGHGEEYKRLAAVAAGGLPHVLPVAFPEPPDVGGDGDPALHVDLEELRHWDQAPQNPARLAAAGIKLAFTSRGLGDPADLYGKLATAIEHGLDPGLALAGITTVPAALYGLGDRLGTVEPGKIANLVLVEGELFVDDPEIYEVWIDGRRLDLEDLAPPEVDPAGVWEITVDYEGMQMLFTLTLEGEPTDLSGTLTTPGGLQSLSSVEVSGETLLFTVGGAEGGIYDMSMKINGERGRGSGSGPPGTFKFRGRRVDRPDGSAAKAGMEVTP